MNNIYFTPEAIIFFALLASALAAMAAMAFQAFHAVNKAHAYRPASKQLIEYRHHG